MLGRVSKSKNLRVQNSVILLGLKRISEDGLSDEVEDDLTEPATIEEAMKMRIGKMLFSVRCHEKE